MKTKLLSFVFSVSLAFATGVVLTYWHLRFDLYQAKLVKACDQEVQRLNGLPPVTKTEGDFSPSWAAGQTPKSDKWFEHLGQDCKFNDQCEFWHPCEKGYTCITNAYGTIPYMCWEGEELWHQCTYEKDGYPAPVEKK